MPTQPDPAMPSAAPDEFVRRRLEAIDGTLREGFDDDARLQNGVPQRNRASELDFIQMSGLTRGTGMPVRPGAISRPVDADAPLSFYESGVVDVDARARSGRGRDAARHQPEAEAPLGAPAASRSADALRALVAELQSEGVAPDEPDAPDGPAETPTQAEAPAHAPREAEPEVEALDDDALSAVIGAWVEEAAPPVTPAAAAPARHESIEDEDFDALLAAFEMPEAQPVETPVEVLDEESLTETIDAADITADTPMEDATPTPDVLADTPLEDADDILREAEALLAAVSEQPRDEEPETLEARPLPAHAAGESPYAFRTPLPFSADEHRGQTEPAEDAQGDDETPEGEFDYGMVTGRRHYGRHFAKRSRRWKRLAALLVLLVIGAIAGGIVYRNYLRPAVLGPERLWSEANAGMDAGRYEEASRQFEQYAVRFPNDGNRAEALFNAAFYRSLPEAGTSVRPARHEEAAALFEKFLREHPGDARIDRARVLLGIAHFNLNHYDEAIRLLRESARELHDPTAALPVLRTLATAYRMQNLYRDAESTYLQAATLPKNFAPDADYFALGEMLRAEAALEEDSETRTALLQRAAEYWARAMESPAIDPIERDKIQTLMDWLNKEMETPAGTEATPPATAPAAPAAAAPAAAPVPAAEQDGTQWDPDPAQEAAYLEKNAGTP